MDEDTIPEAGEPNVLDVQNVESAATPIPTPIQNAPESPVESSVTTPELAQNAEMGAPIQNPTPIQPVSLEMRFKTLLLKVEAEIANLEGARNLFHVFGIKDRLKALIEEAKSVF